jgi:hypothetical protein
MDKGCGSPEVEEVGPGCWRGRTRGLGRPNLGAGGGGSPGVEGREARERGEGTGIKKGREVGVNGEGIGNWGPSVRPLI